MDSTDCSNYPVFDELGMYLSSMITDWCSCGYFAEADLEGLINNVLTWSGLKNARNPISEDFDFKKFF